MNSTWQLVTYDVWGNAEDGYVVNDWYSQGRYEFEAVDPTDAQFITEAGADVAEVEADEYGDEDVAYFIAKVDGKPVFEFRRVTEGV